MEQHTKWGDMVQPKRSLLLPSFLLFLLRHFLSSSSTEREEATSNRQRHRTVPQSSDFETWGTTAIVPNSQRLAPQTRPIMGEDGLESSLPARMRWTNPTSPCCTAKSMGMAGVPVAKSPNFQRPFLVRTSTLPPSVPIRISECTLGAIPIRLAML